MTEFEIGTKFSWNGDVWLITFITNDNYYALIENEVGEKDIRSIDSLEVFKKDGCVTLLK